MLLAKQYSVSPVYSNRNQVQLIKGGRAYFDLLEELIGKAKHTIHLQTYIYVNDETGLRITNALIAAAKRGVAVFVLLDGYGSQQISERWTHLLTDHGVNFRWFAPVMHTRNYYFGRRLHHKIFVADATFSLVGGMNITDRYNDMPGDPAWLDWALYCEGESSADLFMVCVDVWTRSSWQKAKRDFIRQNLPTHLPKTECLVRVRRNDWVRAYNQITRSYLEMFKKAEFHIIIMSSYFLPGRKFRKAILSAVKRGVKIQIIAAGKSDVITAKQAERHLYRWLLKNNIELYEYQPHILHGKISSYDGKWLTVGSYNVNDISTYASIELNMDVLNKPFVNEVENVLNKIIKNDCVRQTAASFSAHNTLPKRIWQRICYQFVRAVFVLFTFYFRQRKWNTENFEQGS